MNIKYQRYIDMIKNNQYEILLAELIVKVINDETLNFGERKLLLVCHNEINKDYKIGENNEK